MYKEDNTEQVNYMLDILQHFCILLTLQKQPGPGPGPVLVLSFNFLFECLFLLTFFTESIKQT